MSSQTLVLFAHYDPQDVVDPYVLRYLEALRGLDAEIILVSDSAGLNPDPAVSALCAEAYISPARCRDFGLWHDGYLRAREKGWLDQVERIAFVNDSVYGPLFPLKEMWASFTGADMYGALESNETFVRHVQGPFMVFDLTARVREFLDEFWDGFDYIADPQQQILHYETGLSRRARAAGLTIKPFVAAADVQKIYPRWLDHPYAPQLDAMVRQWDADPRVRDTDFGDAGPLTGPPINNALYFWDGLIAEFRFPFLKTKLPRYNWPIFASMTGLEDFLVQHTDYPYDLIESNVERLGCGPNSPSWEVPQQVVLR